MPEMIIYLFIYLFIINIVYTAHKSLKQILIMTETLTKIKHANSTNVSHQNTIKPIREQLSLLRLAWGSLCSDAVFFLLHSILPAYAHRNTSSHLR